ncbi:MAG: hypothetical protein PUB14_05335 [Lachnospiraceae bacterium]|nr:hypothetical protein [Lachnospiraceae bacterium]
MKWVETLYLSPKLEKQREEIGPRARALDFPPFARIFFLHRRDAGKLQIVMVPVEEVKLRREEFAGETYLGVGIAENRKEALELAQHLAEEAAGQTGSPDAAAYLAEKFKVQI